jgi:Short C-terminal domain
MGDDNIELSDSEAADAGSTGRNDVPMPDLGPSPTESSAPENHLVLQENAGVLSRWAACEKCGETQWVPAQKTFAWKCKNCSAKNKEHLGILLPQVRIYGSGFGSSGEKGQFNFFKSGVRVKPNSLLGGGGFGRWDNVSDFSVDDPEGFQKRYTATRILALGVFATAAPKWQGTSHLTIRSGDDGWTAMFKMPSLALEQKVQPARKEWERYRPDKEEPASAEPQVEDIPSKIRQLGSLRDEGLITEEEYAAKKRELLERM